MKDNFIHVCFIIDKSGSMYGSENDVIGGFKKVINEQKMNNIGTCAVSLYEFDQKIIKHFVGMDINLVNENLEYSPGGSTAMNDAIGTAVTEIGKWLSDMPEEERPSKNLIVIMTDGEENSSQEYSLQQVKDMIKEQTEKYSWEFIYLGTDITTTEYAEDLGINHRGYTTKDYHAKHYDWVNSTVSSFRSKDASIAVQDMVHELDNLNTEYEKLTGLKMS